MDYLIGIDIGTSGAKAVLYGVSVNITRKYYRVGIVNLCGKIIISTKMEFDRRNPYSVLDEIYEIIMSQINIKNFRMLLGIGITILRSS